jgi:molecular chaperone GrpE
MPGPFGDDDDDKPPAPAEADAEAALAPATVEPTDDENDEAEILAYEQRARLAEDRLAEVLAAYRQMKVDTEKHRERLQKNLDRRFEQRLLLKFIEVLDNLDRALEAAQISYAGQPLLEGMILVRTQLLQVLKDEGLERIPALGTPFDPHVAESVGTVPTGEVDQQGLVLKELQRGYPLKGRIARAARVMIGEYVEGYVAPVLRTPVLDEAVVGEREAGSEPSVPAAGDAGAEPPPPPADGGDGPSIEEIVSRIAGGQEAVVEPVDPDKKDTD